MAQIYKLVHSLTIIVMSMLITMATYALLNAALWSWLAALLAFAFSVALQITPRVMEIEDHIADRAATAATKLAGFLRRVAA